MDKFEFIVNEIKKFSPKITIDGSFGNADFVNLINKYPKIIVYIAGYNIVPGGKGGLFGGLFGGGSSKTTLVFDYKNRDVPYDLIYPCNDVKGMENVLVYNLKKFNTRIAYVVTNSELMNRFVNGISGGYIPAQHPFYKRMQCEGGTFPGTRYMYFVTDIEYHVNPNELKEMDRKVELEVNHIAQMIFDPSMPKEAKVLLVHNYIAYIATYDPSYLRKEISFNPNSHSAYGALISKVCVCHGFAEAFKRILNRGGVECEIVTGYLAAAKQNHAWNIVKLDDGYYHVDVTLDDQAEIMFTYFMKNDAYMIGSRTWNESLYPRCNGSKNVLAIAKTYIEANKSKLIMKGLKLPMLKTL